MKVLVAPDKFKGSLSAAAAAEAIARGWRQGWPECDVELAPIADGGEGFAEIFQQALGAEWVRLEVQDPLGRPVQGRYAWVEAQKLAVLEMSEASGLWRLRPEERAPLKAHTFGTGQLMRHAAERGAWKILVGLGGSATTDGGAGMASALGFEFYAEDGRKLSPEPGNFAEVARMEISGALRLPEVIGACDVANPLLGPDGTAHVFSPQKGADSATVDALERGLTRLAEVVERKLARETRAIPGAGAAGGFGFGLLAFCGGSLRSGFDLVAETLGLEQKIRACDLVITGEGRLDSQTLSGKGPAGIVSVARQAGKPVLALAGSLSDGAERIFDATCPIVDAPSTLEEAMRQASANLERAAGRAARMVRLGGRWPGGAPH
jgi:glycerate kinase